MSITYYHVWFTCDETPDQEGFTTTDLDWAMGVVQRDTLAEIAEEWSAFIRDFAWTGELSARAEFYLFDPETGAESWAPCSFELVPEDEN